MNALKQERLSRDFFMRDVLEVAPDLLGKILVVKMHDDELCRYLINETEAYRGDGDLACHASKGRTKRTEVMYQKGGHVYVYLIYGIHWMFNIVTGKENEPQAVLIRGVEGIVGPGRLGKALLLNNDFYGEDLCCSKRMWLEDAPRVKYQKSPRVGIDYAGEPWVSKAWRYRSISPK